MERYGAIAAPEKQKSFDITASARMFRYDLEQYGRILRETREQAENEELSRIAEGVDRAACTDFVLQRNEEGELVYFYQGKWRPYTTMLMTGHQVAECEAKEDPHRDFLAEWAMRDLIKGNQMNALRPGEQMVWHNAYPKDVAERYGDKFMRQCGLVPEREMGFLYRAACLEDGSVLLETHTVDRSDPEAFEAAMRAADYDPDNDMDTLVRTYDGVLVEKHGGTFRAGRRDTEIEQNAWESIKAQQDLVEYHFSELERIAGLPLDPVSFEYAVKRHTYSVWAAFKKRLDGAASRAPAQENDKYAPLRTNSISNSFHIMLEVQQAFYEFARAGKAFIGCGGSIEMFLNENDVLAADPEDVLKAIFGRNSEKYNFDKKMYCVVCQAPPKNGQEKKMCGPCGLCRDCDKKAGGKG